MSRLKAWVVWSGMYSPKLWSFMEKLVEVMEMHKHWPKMAATLLCLVVKSVTEASQPILLGVMFNILGNSNSSALDKAPVWLSRVLEFLSLGSVEVNSASTNPRLIIMLLFLLAVLRAMAEGLNIYTNSIVQYVAKLRLRKVLYRHLLKQERAYFDQMGPSFLNGIIKADAITELIGYRFFYLIADLIRFAVFLVYMATISLPMTAITLVSLPLVVGLSQSIINKPMRRLEEIERRHFLRADTEADETIRLVETVKAFSREDFHVQKHNAELNNIEPVIHEKCIRRGAWEGISHTVQTAIFCACLLYVFGFTIDRDYSPGTLTSFFLLSQQIRGFAAAIEQHYRTVMEKYLMIKAMFDFMSREPKIQSGPRMINKRRIKGDVEFKNVHFHYPTRQNVSVLQGFSMRIKPGRMIALVGASGAGKSTIASLLLRFYDPTKGIICVDGVDIRHYNLETYHENVNEISNSTFAHIVRNNLFK